MIDRNYLEEPEKEELEEGLYAGLLYGLGDPYSYYYTEEEYEEESSATEGAYVESAWRCRRTLRAASG